jgi:hypothetical protein
LVIFSLRSGPCDEGASSFAARLPQPTNRRYAGLNAGVAGLFPGRTQIFGDLQPALADAGSNPDRELDDVGWPIWQKSN